VSRITDLSSYVAITVPDSSRHCNEFPCGKCRARARFMRRRAWRSAKSVNRSDRSRKR
jgi:hypothetical protein